MRHSSLSSLAASVGSAAVAGYGLSIGRDFWKSTKKNRGLLLILLVIGCALALPLLGGRGLLRGHDRGFFGTVVATVIGNLFLVSAGFAISFALIAFVGSSQVQDADTVVGAALITAAGVTAVPSLAGLIWGVLQRPTRLRTFRTVRANDEFLKLVGITETGGDDITHHSPEGPLRLLEAHRDRLVFMVVGRRGKRAYIKLSEDGRMVAYSGVAEHPRCNNGISNDRS